MIQLKCQTLCTIVNLILLCFTSVSVEKVISIAQGKLRGTTHEGYVSYTGIPYATMSSTSGRFMRAGLAPSWPGTREPHQSYCVSTSRVEECLQLDVHVPVFNSPPWPVIVWIKGGSGNYHPRMLTQHGIIVVTVSHRLNSLGFLCLGDEHVPGNAGAKDVVLALRWVRDNIIAFEGNPYQVIVAGQGFGAAIAEALMLSPMAEGLFHGIIMQSGTVLSPWAFNYDAHKRARSLSMMLDKTDEIASTLMNAHVEDLNVKTISLDNPYFPFGMSVEKSFKKEEQFLSEPPILASKNKINAVPILAGYNSNEAYIFLTSLNQSQAMKKMSKDMTFLLPEELKFLSISELKQVMKQVEDMYFHNNSTMEAVLSYYRDVFFINHIHRSVRLHVSSSLFPVYYYEFSYSSNIGIVADKKVKKNGASHSDELGYLFPENGKQFEGDDGFVQEKLLKLWTNFVKYLNPTPATKNDLPRWDAVNLDNPRLLNIDKQLEMKDFPYTKETQMWDDVYDRYYYTRYS